MVGTPGLLVGTSIGRLPVQVAIENSIPDKLQITFRSTEPVICPRIPKNPYGFFSRLIPVESPEVSQKPR